MSTQLDSTFNMRLFQLDLARQPQPPAFVKKYIDFIAGAGFNTLILYLEGRVRTQSFHLLPEDETYSPEEIKDIVAYASSKGIETIPAVSMLGHAKIFLQFKELESYAELRDGVQGRFSSVKQVFCASSPSAFDFISRYVAEVAELFPAPYFHAGFDESWDIGYCSECRKRLQEEGQSGIFLKYLLDCHRFITGTLHKKMLIWDDMLELYKDIIPRLPRDIILCAWHYERTLEQPGGHIGGPRRDIFALYEKLGFPYLFAPAASSWRNIQSFTAYVLRQGHHPLGAFLTSWEVGTPLWFPIIAATGRLWSEGHADPLEEIRRLTDLDQPQVLSLIRRWLEHAEAMTLPSSPEAYLKGMLSDSEYMSELQLQSDLLLLDGPQQGILEEDVSIRLEKLRLYYAMRRIISAWYGLTDHHLNGLDLQSALEQLKETAEGLRDRELALGEKQGYAPGVLRRLVSLSPVIAMLEKLLTQPRPRTGAFLFLRVPASPEHSFHGTVSLRLQGENQFRQIWKGGCAQNIIPDEFRQYLPVDCPGIPEELMIETDGLIGTSLSYVRILKDNQSYVPRAISDIGGRVLSPESMLADGRNWCTMGEGDQPAYRKFLDPMQARQVHSLTLLLQKETY